MLSAGKKIVNDSKQGAKLSVENLMLLSAKLFCQSAANQNYKDGQERDLA